MHSNHVTPSNFIKPFRLVLDDSGQSIHSIGGANRYKAICPSCKNPLLLLSSIHINLQNEDPTGLDTLPSDCNNFLPLLYCWRCAAAVYYQVLKGGVTVLGASGTYQGDDFPYLHYPKEFPMRNIDLEEIPLAIYKNIIFIQEFDRDFKLVTKNDITQLSRWFDKKVQCHDDLLRHQFGGTIFRIQRRSPIQCPNPACERHELSSTLFSMRELASLYNDHEFGLPMVENPHEYVQVIFHICEECKTIHAMNECD